MEIVETKQLVTITNVLLSTHRSGRYELELMPKFIEKNYENAPSAKFIEIAKGLTHITEYMFLDQRWRRFDTYDFDETVTIIRWIHDGYSEHMIPYWRQY